MNISRFIPRYWLLLAGLGLLLAATPIFSQDTTCDIDLSDIAVLLIQAQDAAGAGDQTTALSLLAEAEAQIGALRTECGGALGAFNTFVTSNAEFRFNYPADYAFFERNRTTFIVATSENARDLFFETGPEFPAGEQAIGVLIGDARQVGGNRGDDLEAITAGYADQLTETGYETADVAEITLGENAATRLDFSGEGFSSALIVIDLGDDSFAVVIGTGAADEFDALEPIILGIATSVEPAPIPEPEPITLEQTYNLAGQLSFDYPESWLISDEDLGSGESVLVGSNARILDALSGSDTPNLTSSDIVIGVIYGSPEELSNEDIGPDAELEDFVEDLDILVGTSGLTTGFVTYGDFRVYEATLSVQGAPFSALLNVVELEPGQDYAIVLMVIAQNSFEENFPLLQAVTASIRFPPSGDPIGPRNAE